jgi:hypothetical protein
VVCHVATATTCDEDLCAKRLCAIKGEDARARATCVDRCEQTGSARAHHKYVDLTHVDVHLVAAR